jgi:hypothetical protein
MGRYAGISLLVSFALLCACSHTVLVSVPPRVDLKNYGTLGIVDFASNSDAAVRARATRQFEEEIQAAQPGTRFIELGERDALLAAVGSRQLDVDSLKKIGAKYGVGAVFVGELAYSEPRVDVKLTDVAKLEGGVKAEMRGDISSRLLETASGASVWSNSAWARRQIGSLSVSASQGVSGGMHNENPREAMLPTLVYQLTYAFRPSTVRQPAN